MVRIGLWRTAAAGVVAGIATLVLMLAWPSLGSAQDEPQWDQERLTRLAAQLHETVKDLRQEVGSQRPHIASLDASGLTTSASEPSRNT